MTRTLVHAGQATDQNPKHSILDSQSRARNPSFKYTQLLTEGKDLDAEIVAGTEESAEAGEKADEEWNHRPGFITQGSAPASTLIA